MIGLKLAVTLSPVLLLLISNLEVCLTANILGIFIVYSESHMIVKSTLFRELASRGHNVTVVTSVADKDSNYEEIIVDEIMTITKEYGQKVLKNERTSNMMLFLWSRGQAICEITLKNRHIQELIHSTGRHYDLIVLEAYFSDCFVPLSKKFNAPIIKISTFSGTPWMYDWVGNPTELSYVPDPFVHYTDKMTFWQRFWNVYTTLFYKLTRNFYHLPKLDSLIRRYYNESEKLPPLWELEIESTSLLFVNTHFSISYPRSLLPNVIQIGGLHLKPPKVLPQEIQSYLDEAQHGVIYFSMGSIFRSEFFPEPVRKSLLESFSKLKENILWKWETESLPEKPKNVKVKKWLPQADILAHPNVRAFITHGGQMSSMEAINTGVPVIGIPLFGDQHLNMARAEAAGIGVRLDISNVTLESVTWALREVLDNPMYRANAQRLSRLFRDQQQQPLEKAVYWTEYVIRHKGAHHMRSAALGLTWYQYYLLDVIALYAIVVIFIFMLFLFLCRYLWKKFKILRITMYCETEAKKHK